MNKNQLRRRYLTTRDRIPGSLRKEKDKIITASIKNSPWFEEAARIFIYISVRSEADTRALIQLAWEEGKKVFVPVIPDGDMQFVPLNSFDELKPAGFGLLEPSCTEDKIGKSDSKTLFVVPLVAFNKDNYRIGYGKGYYDRYLLRHERLAAVGVGYREQYCKELLPDPWDIPLDGVVHD